MAGKIVAIIYLITLLTTVCILWRNSININNILMLKKILTVLFVGYCISLAYVYIFNYKMQKPFLLLSMLGFCLFISFIIFIFEKYRYDGDLNVFMIAILLNTISILILYRLNVSSPWSLAGLFGYKENVSRAFQQLIYSIISLLFIAFGIVSGIFSKALVIIERQKNPLFWGFIALTLLLLPKLLGLGPLMSQDKSIQPTEFAFKVVFIFFIAAFFRKHASELILKHYPLQEILKITLFIFICTVLFFLLPMLIANRELGTSLLLALCSVVLVTYFTKRISFLIVGIFSIAFIIFLGALISDHVAMRVFGTWLNWRNYAFTIYGDSGSTPGFQIFQAISSLKLSPWGVGLGNGILNYNSGNTVVPLAVNDFIIIPVVYELGITALGIIGIAYLVLIDKSVPQNRSLSFSFRSIVAAGIVVVILVQSFYNLSSVIALFPPTGVPLPWISHGGSAMAANYLLIGFLTVIINENKTDYHGDGNDNL